MWLINTDNFELEMFSSSKSIPPYAILSHTWGKDKDEVAFKEMTPGVESSPTAEKPGFKKIKMACIKARTEHSLKYAWVDTCCIDKSSSAELTEAINSMFKWYQQAVVCFVFLIDLEPESQALEDCNWFRRGWTLQELIAPRHIRFFDKTWKYYGDKKDLEKEIARISGISKFVLSGRQSLAYEPVAVRMSWAAMRETTREEDLAYCLLGIFDVNMPMLYGEGEKAFIRLQEEIIKEIPDMSIFAWKASKDMDYSGLLARSPAEFKDAGVLRTTQDEVFDASDFSITNRGIRFNVPLAWDSHTGHYILPLNHAHWEDPHDDFAIGAYLRQVGSDLFVREFPHVFGEPRQYTTKDIGAIQVVKTLSAENATAINECVTHIREPEDLKHPDFQLSRVKPAGCWDPSKKMLYAGHPGIFLGYMKFSPAWADEFDSFILVCRFDITKDWKHGPPWRYCLVRGDEWKSIKSRYHEHYEYDSDAFRSFESRRGPKELSLDLPHLYDESKAKRVVVLLRDGKLDPGESPDSQSLEIRVEDK